MTWNIVPLPAPEELVFGYNPSPLIKNGSDAPRPPDPARRQPLVFVTIFAALAILAGLQNALSDHPALGQRRIAEVNLHERKSECRACADPVGETATPNL